METRDRGDRGQGQGTGTGDRGQGTWAGGYDCDLGVSSWRCAVASRGVEDGTPMVRCCSEVRRRAFVSGLSGGELTCAAAGSGGGGGGLAVNCDEPLARLKPAPPPPPPPPLVLALALALGTAGASATLRAVASSGMALTTVVSCAGLEPPTEAAVGGCTPPLAPAPALSTITYLAASVVVGCGGERAPLTTLT
jgi:hypothetical protein